MSLSPSSSVSIGEAAIFQYLQNEAVLLNMASQQYFALDEAGAEMWRLLMEDGDPESVVRRLSGIYEADEATLRRDLEGLIERLIDAGLLRKCEPGASDSRP